MSERQIDEAIDQAVRELMNVDADSAFRARVVERLRQPKSRGPFWRQLSIVAGAAALAVIVVVMTRDGEKKAVEAPPAAVAAVATAPRSARPPATQPSPLSVKRPAAAPVARHRPGNPTHQITRGALVATVADEAFEFPPAGRVESLGDIRPIELAQIAPAPIITTAIAIAPIAPPSELVIAPVAPQIERE